jgi:hypothetical protein
VSCPSARAAPGTEDTETEGEFRHRIALQACGRRVSEAIRADYGDLAAAFASMGGNTQRAMHIAERGVTEGRRIAIKKLTEVLASQGHQLSYAAPFIKALCGLSIEEAPTKKIWAAVFRFNGGPVKYSGRRRNWKARTETTNPF